MLHFKNQMGKFLHQMIFLTLSFSICVSFSSADPVDKETEPIFSRNCGMIYQSDILKHHVRVNVVSSDSSTCHFVVTLKTKIEIQISLDTDLLPPGQPPFGGFTFPDDFNTTQSFFIPFQPPPQQLTPLIIPFNQTVKSIEVPPGQARTVEAKDITSIEIKCDHKSEDTRPLCQGKYTITYLD